MLGPEMETPPRPPPPVYGYRYRPQVYLLMSMQRYIVAWGQSLQAVARGFVAVREGVARCFAQRSAAERGERRRRTVAPLTR